MPAVTAERTAPGNQNTSSTSYESAHRPLRLRSDDPASLASTANSIASLLISNFLPSVQPPRSDSLVVASSGEDLSNFHDVTLDFFDDDDDLFGSPLAFDASDEGLWNGRFVPPPPRPPFFEDEPVLSDGLTTCDLCSWAMPTKSTFIFEGTIEKASELGWPLTLIIVSILSALLGAIIMVTVVRCRRQKSSNNRNETHVQWWSRNKRPNNSNNNNNHLRRSNIYTAHPADSIRGLHQPPLSASSSLTAMTAMGAAAAAIQASAAAAAATEVGATHQQQQQYYHQQQQQQMQQQFQPNAVIPHQQLQLPQEYEYEHEYHQPQELQQHRRSSSISSSASSPSLTATITTMVPLPMQMQHHHHHHQQLECSSKIWQNGSTMAVAS